MVSWALLWLSTSLIMVTHFCLTPNLGCNAKIWVQLHSCSYLEPPLQKTIEKEIREEKKTMQEAMGLFRIQNCVVRSHHRIRRQSSRIHVHTADATRQNSFVSSASAVCIGHKNAQSPRQEDMQLLQDCNKMNECFITRLANMLKTQLFYLRIESCVWLKAFVLTH